MEESIMIPTSSEKELKQEFPYMKNVILPLRVMNMWPDPEKQNSIRYHLEVGFTAVICITLGVSCCITIITDYEDFDSTVFLVDSVMVTVTVTFRFMYMYIKREKFIRLISLIRYNFIQFSLFPKENRASILKYSNFARNLNVVYATSGLFFIVQICTTPLVNYIWEILSSGLNGTKHISYPIVRKMYAPFDYEKQPGNALFYIFQFTSFTVIAWIYMISDCFWYTVIILTTGQLILLKDSVNTITEILKRKDSAEECELLKENEIQNVADGLRHCIRHHIFLREFVGNLDDLSNPNMLVDSLHAVISMGFVLLEMTVAIKVGDTNGVLDSFQNFITLIGHIFIYDWLGNELTAKEEELAEAIYEVPWYKCPSQKPYITLMLIQARRPSKLTGGRMYTLNFQFFISLMQGAFSYFTFFLEFSN